MNSLSSSQSLDDNILFELDKICSRSLKKRLTNELVEFVKNGSYVDVEYKENFKNSNNSTIIVTIVPNNENIVYHFTIKKDYPFCYPTNFRINYKDYKNFLKIDSLKTLNELRIYNKIQCLSCQTISCGTNWSPSLKMQNFINEFKKMKKYRRDIMYRLLIGKIVDKYLISDINIYEWLNVKYNYILKE